MLAFEDRYTRQRQLPQVGLSGQDRIAELKAELGAGEGSEVALCYLHRAGAKGVRLTPGTPPTDFPHAEFFQHAGPREVGTGAHSALRLIALELGFAQALRKHP